MKEERFQSFNPATEEVLAEFRVSDSLEVNKKIELLRKYQKDWKQVLPEKRKEIFIKYSDLIENNSKELSELVTKEEGKPLNESIGEVLDAAGRVKWFCENFERVIKTQHINKDNVNGEIVNEPIGVVGAIKPWNFPVGIPLWTIVPALLCGNTVLFKPSEYTTLIGERLVKLLYEANLPESSLQICYGSEETGKSIVNSSVDMISFVGSRKAGESIYKNSADKIRPLILELGGKDPMIILDDADMNKAIIGAAIGAYKNCGQVCCSVERIYIHKNLYEEFKEKSLERINNLKIGNGLSKDTEIGPMVSSEQRELLDAQIKDAVKNGVKLLTGGERIEGRGYFYKPTVLENVPEQARLYYEEGFGPLVTFYKYETEQELIDKVNANGYGLTASIYSENEERVRKLMNYVNAGTICWNKPVGSIVLFPWGGVKQSGTGRMLGDEGIKSFTQTLVFRK